MEEDSIANTIESGRREKVAAEERADEEARDDFMAFNASAGANNQGADRSGVSSLDYQKEGADSELGDGIDSEMDDNQNQQI